MINYLFIILLPVFLSKTPPSNAQSYTNITRGTSLTPLGPLISWPSPSGDFAFGFYPMDSTNSLFLLAIYFNVTTPKTIIWFANDQIALQVQAGARFDFTSDGQFSLVDQSGHTAWNPGVYSASHAAILDTGNLVIIGLDSSILWQSFIPGLYTLVPTQVLTQGDMLLSRLTEFDYNTGRFQVVNQKDGNLAFYTVNAATGGRYDWYWYTGTESNHTRLVFSGAGILFFDLMNGTKLNMTNATSFSTKDFYMRMTLDTDGAFRQYVYPKAGANTSFPRKWTVVASIPSDICQLVTWKGGSGTCGFNSYCTLTESNQTSSCHCPPHYSFLDPTREYKGCKPDFPPQSCDIDESSLFEFTELNATDWLNDDYEIYEPVTEDLCRKFCLSDCFCGAAVFTNGTCELKKLPLSNGRMGSYVEGKTLIKVSKGNHSLPQNQTNLVIVKKDRGVFVVVASVLLGLSGVANLGFFAAGLIVCRRRRRLTQKVRTSSSDPSVSPMILRAFSYKELEEATKKFSEELGSGAFGTVYKGVIVLESRASIAVKRLDHKQFGGDYEKEFMNEVRSIGLTHHKNLVRLFGFCNEGKHRLLVYEYMANGSLTSFLFNANRPSWKTRIQIALGIARGLVYLHEGCSTQIIHCDIKPQNILLDDNFVARISDFGLAKLLMNDQTRTHTGIRGTRGYVAPEWFRSVAVTAKVDVYSFGVMLLEIVCCRKNIELEVKEDMVVLTYWAYDCFRDGKLKELVVNDEEAMDDMGMVERFVMVAIWCLQEEPSLRPSMKEVSQMLEGAVTLSLPPDPSPAH